MVQRYKFESKSQRNLKANHNAHQLPLIDHLLFPMVQRYKFESKSQRKLENKVFRGVVSNGSKVQI